MHEKSSKYMDLEDEDSDEDMTSGNCKTQASPLDPITDTATTVLSTIPAVPSTFPNSPFGFSKGCVSVPFVPAPPDSWTFSSGYSGLGCSSELVSRILSFHGVAESEVFLPLALPRGTEDVLALGMALSSFLPCFLHPLPQEPRD